MLYYLQSNMDQSYVEKTFIFTPEDLRNSYGSYKSCPSGFRMEKLELFGRYSDSLTKFHIEQAVSHSEFTLTFHDIYCYIDEGSWKVDLETVKANEGVGWLPCECFERSWCMWFNEIIENWLNTKYISDSILQVESIVE